MEQHGNPQPDPTPEQQQETTADGMRRQYDVVNGMEAANSLPQTLGLGRNSGSAFGRTDFESRDLNSMLDLLETANPSDLEHVGDALAKARDSLNDAARGLDDDIKKADWEGESGREFRRYGGELTKHAWEVASFANAASTQMSVASTGLASVRSSTPKQRDDRLVPKRPEDFESVEQTETNGEYVKAMEVERNRQETINQMGRLASFYAVSEQSLASQKPPMPPKPVRAAVPKPSGSTGTASGPSGAAGAATAGSTGQITPGVGRSGEASDGPSPTVAQGASPSGPAPGTSVQIDSVTAPAPPAPSPSPAPAPTATGPTGPAPGPLVPPPSLGTPPPNGAQRTAGPGIGPSKTGSPTGQPLGKAGQPSTAATPTGRPGTGQNNPAAGRPGTVGRSGPQTSHPAVTGRPTASGPPVHGRGPAGTGRPGSGPAGQAPITGRPSTAQPSAGRAGSTTSSGTPSGRSGGIVGGTPQRTGTGAANGSSPAPRSSAIGSQPAPSNRGLTGRPGQPGVVGSQSASGSARPTGRGTPAPNGVVGTPRNASAGTQPGARGFTSGGSGLTGGRTRTHRPEQEQDRGGERPDYLTEDEETWESRRRNTTPPVID